MGLGAAGFGTAFRRKVSAASPVLRSCRRWRPRPAPLRARRPGSGRPCERANSRRASPGRIAAVPAAACCDRPRQRMRMPMRCGPTGTTATRASQRGVRSGSLRQRDRVGCVGRPAWPPGSPMPTSQPHSRAHTELCAARAFRQNRPSSLPPRSRSWSGRRPLTVASSPRQVKGFRRMQRLRKRHGPACSALAARHERYDGAHRSQ